MLKHLALSLLSLVVPAADWNQWRGPGRDGVVTGTRAAWPEKLTKRWTITVGEGHSSPVFGGGRIYVFAREKGQETTRAIDPATGKVLWTHAYAAPYKINSAAQHHGDGPKSTPLYADGRLYTMGIQGRLTCLDAASGKEIWKKDFADSPDFGTAASPALVAGRIVIHGGGTSKGALVGLNAKTGAVEWSNTSFLPAYASPVAVGAANLATLAKDAILGVNATTGATVWSVKFTTDYDQNSVTPVLYRDLLITGGLNNGTVAFRPAARSLDSVWATKEVALYMNTPVVHKDVLYGLHYRNKGQYFAMDPLTGKVLWTSAPRQGDNASLTLWGDFLVALSTNGDLIVAPATREEWKPVRTYKVSDDEVWASPLPLDNGVVVKDHHTLTFWAF